MTSDRSYVWTWLPGRATPVPAGLVIAERGVHSFQYGRSYLERPDAIGLGPELPLRKGIQLPAGGMSLAGCIRDGLPDSWGQRVIATRIAGRNDVDTGDVESITYMLQSGTNRFGANDFQASPVNYLPREDGGTLDQLHAAAQKMMAGEPLEGWLEEAFGHGTSIGGARPKVTLGDGEGHYIAKLSASNDHHNEVRAEAACLHLAGRAGISVPNHGLVESLGRDVLLVERFDRLPGGRRRHALSALTLLELDENSFRYGTYPDFLNALREYPGSRTAHAGADLFSRIAMNIAVGNGDDHPRNHAAFWDGETLELTPAYDIAPQRSGGWDHNQAMAYGPAGERRADLPALVDAASIYGLSRSEATDAVERVVSAVEDGWDEAADFAGLTQVDRKVLMGPMILNPGIMHKSFSTAGLPVPEADPELHHGPVPGRGLCGSRTVTGALCRNPAGSCPHHRATKPA